jgi:dTDP-4-dehydrorhamnose 3,5-epimerase
MQVVATKLAQALIIVPKVFTDKRGSFLESYTEQAYYNAGISEKFVQDNCSYSKQNVLRGLHYQLKKPQGKLIMVMVGKVFDVIVDLRRGSATFGQWLGVELSETNHWQLYIPPGYAHGFFTLSEQVIFHYKCTDYYDPDDQYGILWSDPAINISWPVAHDDCALQLSPKDLVLPLLANVAAANLPSLCAV